MTSNSLRLRRRHRHCITGCLSAFTIAGGAATTVATETTIDAPSPFPGRTIVERQANVFTSSSQDNAALDVDGDGRVLMVWDSRRQEAGTYGVYARCFDPLGRPLSHELHLNEYVLNHQRMPAVSFSPDGSSWFVWQSHGQDGSGGGIVARRYSPDLIPVTAEIPVNLKRQGDQGNAVITALENGGCLVAWTTAQPDDAARETVRARVFNAAGGPVTDEINIGDDTLSMDTLPAIALLPEDRAIVTWARSHRLGDPDGVFSQIIDTADGTVENPVRVSAPDGNQHIEPAIASDDKGRVVVAWLTDGDPQQHNEDTGGYAVAMRRLDATGNAVERTRIIADTTTGWKSGVAVATSPDGRFIVSYNSDGEDGSSDGIFAQVFDADGRFIRAMRINVETDGPQRLTIARAAQRTAWSARDQIAVAWNGDAGDGDSSAANLTLMYPTEMAAQVPAPADLGEALAAVETGSNDFVMGAVPPIWDPNQEPLPPLDDPNVAMGDFGFEAIQNTGWTPPDPEMAVGPSDIVVMSNGEISTFTKGGVVRWRDEIENSFGFWGSLGADNFVFDPEVMWDPHAQRFIAMACERSDNGRSFFLLAVSVDSSPDTASDWHKYRIDVTSISDNDIDSPNLSASTDHILLTADFFGPDKYLLYIIDKSSVLNGGAPVTAHELITGSSQQSMGIPVTYDNDPTLYILQSTETTNNTTVIFHAIEDPFTSYSRSTFTLSVPTYQYPNQPPQRGSSSRPFLFEPRFWSVAQRNGAIWAVHHVNSSRARVRWYEFDLNGWPSTSTPSIAQSGEIDLGGGIHTYFPSIHVNANDDAAITFARSASNEYISMGRVTRASTDPLNEFRSAQVVQTSNNAHVSGRWGDYSSTQADPVDPNAFWGHHEFTNGSTSSWRTWVSRYDMRPAGMELSVDPLIAGANATMEVTGASPGNRVYFVYSLSGTGLTEVPALNATLSLDVPVLGAQATANGAGTATVSRFIPGAAAGLDIWIQAIENTHTSNWIETTIQ